jgi:N6-L-threonylcarbamoyladenine synthase
LLDVPEWGRYRLLGTTRDDAAGEAFDKVAKLLELGYPGGPEIERLAAGGEDKYDFPRPMLKQGLDFSFSGLKTAVLYAVRDCDSLENERQHIAASFQSAVIDVLTNKVARALDHTGYSTVVIGGGVACNRELAVRMANANAGRARIVVARSRFNTDNAAMSARAGWFHLQQGGCSDMTLDADPRMPWPGIERNPEMYPSPR